MRLHDTTRERPIDRLEKERGFLRPLPALPYDTDEILPAVVTPHARVHFDANRYSVPPEFTRKQATLRVDENWLRVIFGGKEIARHHRCYEKRRIIVDPEHQLCWKDSGWNSWLVYAHRCRTLTLQPDGKVLYRNQLVIDGILAGITRLTQGAALDAGMIAENQALAERAGGL